MCTKVVHLSPIRFLKVGVSHMNGAQHAPNTMKEIDLQILQHVNLHWLVRY